MARNGSGTYSRIAGVPYVYNTIIDQVVVNAEMDDIATALTASLAKDGQTTPTANLPMGTYRHTGVGAAAARTDYARAAEVQDGAITKITSVAGTNTITASAPISMAAHAVGQEFTFIPAATNTGAATLNINSIGAGAVQQGGKALVGGELKVGVPVRVLVTAATPVFEIIGSGALFGPHARADIASATTLDLDATLTHSLNVTGTTATTGITLADGSYRILRANAAWPITHGASLICPGSASYTCAAGDLILAIGEPAGVVRLAIWKADGTAVVSSTSSGQLIKYTKITSTNASWAKQAGTNRIVVCCKGGGGAGGGNNTAYSATAEGGFAGCTVWGESSTLTATFVATIGAGGTGVSGASGNSGGTTSFTTSTPTTIASAPGGAGGQYSTVARVYAGQLGMAGQTGEAVGGVGTNAAAGGAAAANSAAGGGGCSGASGSNLTGGAGGSGVIHVWEYS